MKTKMSKSNQTESNSGELSTKSEMKALESERNYWGTRHHLLKKYGK